MKTLRTALLVLLVIVLYELLGILISSAWHRQVSRKTKTSFHSEQCYSEQEGTERVLCIDDNTEALLWRLRVIGTARSELVLSTFEFRDDNSGRDIMCALFQAAERGVHIRIFIDGLNGKIKLAKSDCFHALTSHPNVEVKLYAPINLLKPWNITFCMHDKYLIADQSVYILGGRNVYDYFLGNYPGRKNIDRDLLVYETDQMCKDSSLVQLQNYFESIWELPCSRRIRRSGAGGSDMKNRLLEHYAELKELYPAAFEEPDYNSATIAANKITLLANPQKPFCREPEIWYNLAELMRNKRDVVIHTPYIICNRQMYRDLTEIADSTGSLEIITNAVESGANPWGCTDYLNQKGRILQTGSSVCEFLGCASNHKKTILVDDRMSIVGSYNLDERSTYLDTELMLAVDCRKLNEQLRISAEKDRTFSKQVFSDGNEYYGIHYRTAEMTPDKKRFYQVLRTIIRPFRYLL